MRQNSDVKKKNSCVCVPLYPPIVMIAVPSGLVRRRSHHIEPRTVSPLRHFFVPSQCPGSLPTCLFPFLCTHVFSAHVATMPRSIDCAPVPMFSLSARLYPPSSHKPECSRATKSPCPFPYEPYRLARSVRCVDRRARFLSFTQFQPLYSRLYVGLAPLQTP